MAREQGRAGLAQGGLALLAALLLWSRCPSRLLHPGLWAEDGVLWLAGAWQQGVVGLAVPVVGYLQTISRLAGLLAAQGRLAQAPLLFALVAFAVQLLPALLLLGRRGAVLVPNLPARLALVLYYLLEPNTDEVYVNLTNAMWHLALAAFLLVVLPKPRSRAGVAADLAVLLLSGLSGPLVVFLAPLACWHAWRGGRLGWVYAGLLSACGLLQLACIAMQSAGQRAGHLGATAGRLVHILANQVFVAGIIGGHHAGGLMQQGWWAGWGAGPAMVCLLALAGIVCAARRGPPAYQLLLALAGLCLAAALKTPMITLTQAQWPPLQIPGVGGRYMFLPMLAWFATLLVLAGARPLWLRWPGRALVLACAVGMVADWRVPPYPDSDFGAQARRFDAAPAGTTMNFDESPPGWHFELTKH